MPRTPFLRIDKLDPDWLQLPDELTLEELAEIDAMAASPWSFGQRPDPESGGRFSGSAPAETHPAYIRGLDERTQAAVNGYGTREAYRMNDALRRGVPFGERVTQDAPHLQAAIEKAPPLPRGTVVYRGVEGFPGMSDLAAGSELVLNGFQSCSTEARDAAEFGSTLLRIAPKQGLYIAGSVYDEDEEEYIDAETQKHELVLAHGRKYRVTKTGDRLGGKPVIDLEEL